MKKLSFLLAMFVLMLVFGFAFVGCNNGSTDGGSGNVNVVGRWVGTGEMYGSSITFNQDNTCTFSAFGIILFTGTYSVSGKTVNITTNGETFVATVTGNTMDFGGNLYTKQ